jgi:excisionase family DNA binding protein
MTLATLTPQQAAARAKVSRGTIMNALKEGVLRGFRDNRNRWQINPDDLSEWLSDRGGNITVKDDSHDSVKPPAIDDNALRIAVLETEIKGKDQRISDLERDRDSWKEQAQELARRRARRWWLF